MRISIYNRSLTLSHGQEHLDKALLSVALKAGLGEQLPTRNEILALLRSSWQSLGFQRPHFGRRNGDL